ncbi:hypothetical protein, partial [Caballeronia sp.]|uniref:hypothetical protein n=1 Tax=Caballeronia sp. TaxID=1931223 RepID=UPI003C63F0E9
KVAYWLPEKKYQPAPATVKTSKNPTNAIVAFVLIWFPIAHASTAMPNPASETGTSGRCQPYLRD